MLVKVRAPTPGIGMGLMGGMLVMSSAALLADYAGAVTNLVWLLPAALAVWAAHDEHAPAPPEQRDVAERVAARLNPAALGPAPRITVEQWPAGTGGQGQAGPPPARDA